MLYSRKGGSLRRHLHWYLPESIWHFTIQKQKSNEIDDSDAEENKAPQAQNNELSEVHDVHVSQGLQTDHPPLSGGALATQQ